MRPSRADTSEPACEKRKMLSMKISVSTPVWSRNYSAMVSAERATRRRAPGGSFIWPNTMAVWSMTLLAGVADLRLLHFEPEVVALAGALADAGEARSSRRTRGRRGRSSPE